MNIKQINLKVVSKIFGLPKEITKELLKHVSKNLKTINELYGIIAYFDYCLRQTGYSTTILLKTFYIDKEKFFKVFIYFLEDKELYKKYKELQTETGSVINEPN